MRQSAPLLLVQCFLQRVGEDADALTAVRVKRLLDGRVFHPGDAYQVPPAPVDTLLLPTSGPWTRLGRAADYVREVRPSRLVQIHEIMLSRTGQESTARFLSPAALTEVPLTIVPEGDAITV